MDNSFIEFVTNYFATEWSLFMHSDSFLLPSLPEQMGGKHRTAAAKGGKSEEK